MPLPPVTAESLGDLQARLTKARKALTKSLTEFEQAESKVAVYERALFLDYALKRNGLSFQGTNDKIRQHELEEILMNRPEYQDLVSEVHRLKRQKRDASDTVSELEAQFKKDLSIFEDERHRANRALLMDLVRAKSSDGPTTPAPTEVMVETLQENLQAPSFYSDLG